MHFFLESELKHAQRLVEDGLAKSGMLDVEVNITYNNRLTSTLGQVRRVDIYNKKGRIELSSRLWPTTSKSQRVETVIHELAHILADIKHQRDVGHRKEWKSMMAVLGYPNAKRCHNSPVIRKKRKKYILACRSCMAHSILDVKTRTQRIKNWHNSKYTYICGKCNYLFVRSDFENAIFVGVH